MKPEATSLTNFAPPSGRRRYRMPDRALDRLHVVECGDGVSATYAGAQIAEMAERGVIF